MKKLFALCCFLTTVMLFPRLAAGEWFTDFEKAKAESLKTGRPIFMLFTNSDSAAALSLERTIFGQKKFQNYADSKLVLMKADFPTAIHLQPKSLIQQNSDLRRKYGISALPTMLLLDANGEIYIDFVKADGSAEKHRRKMNEIMDFDPPKRYSEYLDGFVKKYAPPKPVAKKTEAKPDEKKSEAKQPAKKPPRKPDKKSAEKMADDNIPDESAGSPLIPLDPEGDFQEWLKANNRESESVSAEEAKDIEKAEAPAGPAKEEAEAPAPAEK